MKYVLIGLFLLSCSTPIPQRQKVSSVYNRKDWKHWIDPDHNCLNTRQEILKTRSLTTVKTKKNKKSCTITAGKWNDYYYPEVLTSPKVIDIDHIIPLKHAHDLVGDQWSKSQKEAFANDPENLVITDRKYNRQKGALTIAQWTPRNIEYACKYYYDWMKIKKKYGLQISNAEIMAVDLKKCN